MHTRANWQKHLAVFAVVALLLGSLGVCRSMFAAADGDNLLSDLTGKLDANYTVKDGVITVSDAVGANDHFPTYAGITLDANKTYTYAYTVNFSDVSAGQVRLPIRKGAGFDQGQWLAVWFDLKQVRLAEDYWSNVGGVAGTQEIKANTDYRFKIVTEPKKVTVYVDDIKIVERDYTYTVTDGTVGLGGWGLKNYTLKNVSLTEQKAAEPEKVNLLSDLTGKLDANYTVKDGVITVSDAVGANDHFPTYAGITLDANKTYTYAYTVNFSDVSAGQVRLPIRKGAGFDQGQWLAVWFDLKQVRLAEDYWSNVGGVAGTQEIKANTDYRFKIVTEPKKVTVYVDDVKIVERDYTYTVENGTVGLGGWGLKNYTLKNISLTEEASAGPVIDQAAVDAVKELIAGIGTVTADSGEQIRAARAAYDALNDDEKALVDNLDVLTAAESAYTLLTASADMHYYPVGMNDLLGYNHWQGAGFLTTSANAGGGVHFQWKGAGTNIRMGINKSLKLDGAHLELLNYNVTAGGRVAFYFANMTDEGYSQLNTAYGYKFAPMAIVLDTQKGTIEYMSVDWTPDPNDPSITGTVIANEIARSDALKASALSGKSIGLRLKANGDGSWQVTVAGVTGTITKAMLDTATLLSDPDNAYLTLSVNGDGNTLSFDLISLHGGRETCAGDLTREETAAVDAVIAQIAAIGEVTKDSADRIEAAEAAYAALSATQQGLVNNYGTLRAARLMLDRLTASDPYKDVYYYGFTTDDLMGTNHWGSNLTYANGEKGGVHFKWAPGGTDVRMGIDRAMALDGLHLVFDGLKITSGSTMAFYLADLFDFDWAEMYSQFTNGSPLALLLDTSAGTLSVAWRDDGGTKTQVLIQSSSLTYGMLSQVQFDLKITKNADDDNYTVRVLDATGTITPEMLARAKNLTKLDQVYLTVCPWGQNVNMEYTLRALHGGDTVCADEIGEAQKEQLDAVVALIDAVYNERGQIDAASGAKIDKAWAAYGELPEELRSVVSNLARLNTADEVWMVVDAIENIGTVTLDSKEDITVLRAEYKALGPEKRPLVGNYGKLNTAIATLYGLEKEAAIKAMQNGGKDDGKNDGKNDGPDKAPTTGVAMAAAALPVLAAAASSVFVLRRKRER